MLQICVSFFFLLDTEATLKSDIGVVVVRCELLLKYRVKIPLFVNCFYTEFTHFSYKTIIVANYVLLLIFITCIEIIVQKMKCFVVNIDFIFENRDFGLVNVCT